MANWRWVKAAEQARIVRATLKREFPYFTFYVRKGSGGYSVNVDWMDGPSKEQVSAKVGHLHAGTFDGMIDLMSHRDHYLMPDGTVTLAVQRGTAESGGMIERAEFEAPSPDAELIHFEAESLFLHRQCSKARIEAAAAAVEDKFGFDIPEIVEMDWYVGRKPKAKTYEFRYRDVYGTEAYWFDQALKQFDPAAVGS